MEILDRRLDGRTWLVGEQYSIADMATYPWARTYYWAGVSVDGLEHLGAWFARLDGRSATQAALQLPTPKPGFFGRGDVAGAVEANAADF